MASAARHGTASSSATLAHISALNLDEYVSTRELQRVRLTGKLYIPVIQPSKLVFALFVPLAPSFEIVLVVQTAADGASSGQPLRNVVPLHTAASQLYNHCILLGRPFGLLLDRLVVAVG